MWGSGRKCRMEKGVGGVAQEHAAQMEDEDAEAVSGHGGYGDA